VDTKTDVEPKAGEQKELLERHPPSYGASWFQTSLPGTQQSDHSTDGLWVKWCAALGHVPSLSKQNTSPYKAMLSREMEYL